MKFKKIFPKAAAVVMAAVTVFSVLPATTAFAAVGDVGTISFSHTYDGNGNAMRYNSSANINGYIAGGKDAGAMPFAEVMSQYRYLGLPSFESVGRTRRKLQAEHPELLGSIRIQKLRAKQEQNYRRYAKE